MVTNIFCILGLVAFMQPWFLSRLTSCAVLFARAVPTAKQLEWKAYAEVFAEAVFSPGFSSPAQNIFAVDTLGYKPYLKQFGLAVDRLKNNWFLSI